MGLVKQYYFEEINQEKMIEYTQEEMEQNADLGIIEYLEGLGLIYAVEIEDKIYLNFRCRTSADFNDLITVIFKNLDVFCDSIKYIYPKDMIIDTRTVLEVDEHYFLIGRGRLRYITCLIEDIKLDL